MTQIFFRSFIIFISLSLAFCAVLAKHDEGEKSRVLNKILSDEDHFLDDDEMEHNPDYDHEAFLGEDEAREFDQLTPEESVNRLSIIVDKMDADKDGFVTHEELKNWIEHTQRKYILEDVERQWSSHNPKNKDKLLWEEYKAIVYGFMDNMDINDLEANEEGLSYLDMMKRDKRRWELADQNKDDALGLEEFSHFLHPEEAKHMRDIVVTETMEDIDKDNDGKISMEEYIGDMYKGVDDDEPSWVAGERDQFNEFRDKNKDGFMDLEEVLQWIIPSDYDHADSEAKHLLRESDSDGDEQLSKDEILDKYDLFVGSQATDFGEALTRHDEF